MSRLPTRTRRRIPKASIRDGAAWAATASRLGSGGLEEGRDRLRLDGEPAALEREARHVAGDEPIDAALAAHARLVG